MVPGKGNRTRWTEPGSAGCLLRRNFPYDSTFLELVSQLADKMCYTRSSQLHTSSRTYCVPRCQYQMKLSNAYCVLGISHDDNISIKVTLILPILGSNPWFRETKLLAQATLPASKCRAGTGPSLCLGENQGLAALWVSGSCSLRGQ